ncbi:MAG: Lnb N-terminal periplasmic domain-containing protein, partial [Flavisolibacter sp.]
MKKILFLFSFSFLLSQFLFAQDSCSLRISLLTCAPGEELYSTFGHTALRVRDEARGADFVFNYGTFEFAPDFYVKFIRGKLLYSLAVEDFNEFMYEYRMESRTVQEQVLQLSCEEKQKLFTALQNNAKDENRYYQYDFHFDNCTTRAGNIVAANTDTPVVFKNILAGKRPSFRDLIHSYLNAGNEYWSKLGIDMLLGAKLDRKVANREAMFLPEYLLKGFDSASIGGRPLVTPPTTILQMPSPLGGKSFFTPAVVFCVLLGIVVALSFYSARWSRVTLSIFDFLFFFILGLAGLVMLFMWFGTDHKVCGNNWNLLWALPTNVVMAFYVHSKRRWVQNYFSIVFWLTVVLTITWFFLPQQMNNALLPLVLLILWRSWNLS